MVRASDSKRVGIWIRVSTEDQVRGESPETHERRARLYAEAKGWNVIEVYRLDAVSGKTVKETPQAGMSTFLKLAGDCVGGIKDLWWSEMSSADRRGESRSVGKSQAERIDQKIEELQRAKAKLAARQNGGGSGDKA